MYESDEPAGGWPATPPPIKLSSSYRDPRNAECICYPGSFVTKLLIASGIVVAVLTGLFAVALSRTWSDCRVEIATLCVVSLLLTRLWPTELRSDQTGLHERSLFREQRVLAWKDVASVTPGEEFHGPWLTRYGLRTDTLIVSDASGLTRIVHTPRHPDRERLLREMRQWGVRA
jgi:hypothetical protein